jgi:hypothetical protein
MDLSFAFATLIRYLGIVCEISRRSRHHLSTFSVTFLCFGKFPILEAIAVKIPVLKISIHQKKTKRLFQEKNN